MKQINQFPFWARIVILALFASLLTPISARADMAPPQQPPGTNIVPGSEFTQVRMVAETVTLTVLSTPSVKYPGQAKTEAVFMMRNLGPDEEKMDAIFPLTFWNVPNDGYGGHPEINDIKVMVDGNPVETARITAPNLAGDIPDLPWASFPVIFPPGKDVIVTVRYTSNGYGYEYDPDFSLDYILETGAGWQGTIGSADIIVKLPYEANLKNIFLDSTVTKAPEFAGRELRWHFSDFEPSSQDNIHISILKTAYWQKVLDTTEYVRKYPNDGEGWGQLGKAYKEAIRFGKGYLREDPTGEEIYQLGVQAYEKAVSFLPKDAQWHYGFADLLWAHYWGKRADSSELSRAVDELRQSLALDPKNKDARELASWIAGMYPWAISETDKGYDFPILTATPTPAPSVAEGTASDVFTPLPEPSSTPEPLPLPTLTAVPAAETALPAPAKKPSPGLPLCGTALLLPALAGLLWWFSRRH
jgi:tetratricopeptide (TPR) repeat protein